MAKLFTLAVENLLSYGLFRYYGSSVVHAQHYNYETPRFQTLGRGLRLQQPRLLLRWDHGFHKRSVREHTPLFSLYL